jgi:hypothetical protein
VTVDKMRSSHERERNRDAQSYFKRISHGAGQKGNGRPFQTQSLDLLDRFFIF